MPGPIAPLSSAPILAGAGGGLMAPASPASGNMAEAGSLREVAQGFEAMLLRQVLKAASAADFGGDSLFGSSATETFREMRDARFAEIAASSGALGLAAQIEAQLAGQHASLHSASQPAAGQDAGG